MASNIGEIVATATLDVAPFQSNVGRLKTYLKGVDNSLKAMENNFKGAGKNVSNLKVSLIPDWFSSRLLPKIAKFTK